MYSPVLNTVGGSLKIFRNEVNIMAALFVGILAAFWKKEL
jgi:hypothetical protein